MDFAHNLRRLRLEKGLTQSELGKFFSTQKQTISNWENGISTPDLNVVKDIASFFRVTTDELLGAKSEEEITIKQALKDNDFIKFIQFKLALFKQAGQRNGAPPEATAVFDQFNSMSDEDKEKFLSMIYKNVIKTDNGFNMIEQPILETPGMDKIRKKIDSHPQKGQPSKMAEVIKKEAGL